MTPISHIYNETDTLIATTLRMLAIDTINQANSGHPGLPLGAADIITVLWTRFLKHNPSDPTWHNRDRFILSAGHGSALLYAILTLSGYPLTIEDLKQFRQLGSKTPGHPEYDQEIGIETTTGPLGQGLSSAVGMAIAERWLGELFNKPGFPIVDHFTYVLVSDGDLMEGVSHETASLAGHLCLSKLIVLYDDNLISIDGPTEITFTEDVIKRFKAYGWHTQRIDGHDMKAIDSAIQLAQAENTKPSIIACRTNIGLGSPLQDTPKVHGAPLTGEYLIATKRAFNWPVDKEFYIPRDVKSKFIEMNNRGKTEQSKWDTMFSQYRNTFSDQASRWDLHFEDPSLIMWETSLPDFTGGKPLATRVASGQVLDAIAPKFPSLLGGSADLTGSNKTKPKFSVSISSKDFSGTYIHYGVREHGMGGIMNGLAAYGGIRPYGGTFLVFSDYMRPAIRLAAMMGLPVIYVFTHDSIGLGEDGPTHQPVEHLTALRSIPNLVVIRPFDGNETSQAWRVALKRTNGPTALILSRQSLPQITPRSNNLDRGAYVLISSEIDPPEISLIGTGSEVNIAIETYKELMQLGIATRVVSMPSWELFKEQPIEYQDSVIPSTIPNITLEAGVTLAWARYTGMNGISLGIDRFGESAPYERVYNHFGLTPEIVLVRALEVLGK